MNTHDAIIDAFVFESAQSVIQQKRSVYFKSHGKYDYFEETENILKGYVYCSECGGRLTRRKEVYAQGSKMQYVYVCAKHENYGNEVCSNKTRIHENDLLENVFKQLQAYIIKALNKTALSASKDFQVQKEKLLRKISKSDESIKEINGRKCTVFEAYVKGNLSADEFKIKLSELEHIQKELKKQLFICRSEIAALDAKEKPDAIQRKKLLSFRDAVSLNKEMLKTPVYRIIISGEGTVSVKYIG